VPELVDIARRVATAACGGEQVEAYVSWTKDTHVRAYDRGIETLSSAEGAGVGVRVIVGKKQGFAYVGSLEGDAPVEALAEARDNAGFASEDEHAAIASPDGVEALELDLWRYELVSTPTEAKTEMALELERLAYAVDKRIRTVVEADYSDTAIEFAIATSTGIEESGRRTRCYVGTEVIADDGRGDQTGYGYSLGRAPLDLDLEDAAAKAVERAVRLLGATKPPSAPVTVVLDPRVTATLLSVLASTLSGEEVAKGRSLFAGRVGEEVAHPAFRLVDDPTNTAAPGAARVDSEGLACRRNVLIEDGRLLGYLYDTRAGHLAGVRSTASAVRGGFKSTPGVGARALTLDRGEHDPEEILRLVGEGLYVQKVSGVHSGVNRVSGDFSVGAVGLLISGGSFAEPVREFTIASTIQRMLQHVLFIGSDLTWPAGNACGLTLAIGEMSMGGA
jgi:PmbA protein